MYPYLIKTLEDKAGANILMWSSIGFPRIVKSRAIKEETIRILTKQGSKIGTLSHRNILRRNRYTDRGKGHIYLKIPNFPCRHGHETTVLNLYFKTVATTLYRDTASGKRHDTFLIPNLNVTLYSLSLHSMFLRCSEW